MAGLYLHVPFCTQRCVYCDFYFTTTSADYSAFTDALLVEIEAYAARYGLKGGQKPLRSLYFGGGTPSLLPLDQVARVVQAVDQHFGLGEVEEVTFEMNPENASPVYLGGLAKGWASTASRSAFSRFSRKT